MSRPASEADYQKLAGRWRRLDGGYFLEFSRVERNGAVRAQYFNPQPVNVSRAEWQQQDGRLGVFVELRAPNYPGSTYTLVYDPASDRLVGVYYQAALGQQYDIEFRRIQ